jgi:hypothetical protein
MNIELASASTIKITWPYYDSAIEAEIVQRLNTVPGIEGRPRRYYAPVIQLPRLMNLFPKASFDYAAMVAADNAAQAFYNMLVRFDLHLEIGPENGLILVGDSASPAIQQLVDERAPALRPLVLDALNNPKPSIWPAQREASSPLTEDERLGPLFRGIQNAAKKAEEQRVKYPRRRHIKSSARS